MTARVTVPRFQVHQPTFKPPCLFASRTPTDPNPGEQVLGQQITFEQALDAVGRTTGEFLADSQAGSGLPEAVSMLFETSSDLDTALNAARQSVAEQLQTAAHYKALQDNSLPFGGTYVEGSWAADAASAQIIPRSCDTDSKTVVIFINGVNNTYVEFLASWAALAKLLREGADTVSPKVDGYYNLSAVDADRSVWGGKLCYLWGASSWLPNSVSLELTEWCRTIGGVVIDLAECGAQTANIQRWIASVPPVPDAQAPTRCRSAWSLRPSPPAFSCLRQSVGARFDAIGERQ